MLDARVLGEIGELLLEDFGGDLRQTNQVGVVWVKEQIGNQLRIQDPEKVLEAGWGNRIQGKRGPWLDQER